MADWAKLTIGVGSKQNEITRFVNLDTVAFIERLDGGKSKLFFCGGNEMIVWLDPDEALEIGATTKSGRLR